MRKILISLLLIIVAPVLAQQSSFTWETNAGSIYLVSWVDSTTNRNVTIPDNIEGLPVVSIGNAFRSTNDFYVGKPISSLTIGTNIPYINDDAFNACSNLTSISLGNKISSIGIRSFKLCTNLTSVVIPNSVTTIKQDAFFRCDNLSSVTLSTNLINLDGFGYCTALKNISIPSSVQNIKNACFSYSSLTNIVIPNSVTNLESFVFYGCASLNGTTLSTNISYINTYSFYQCTNLFNVTIPVNVTIIDNYSFSGCSGLTNIVFLRTNAPTVNITAFNGVTSFATISDGATGYSNTFYGLNMRFWPSGWTAFNWTTNINYITLSSWTNQSTNTPLIPDVIEALPVRSFGTTFSTNVKFAGYSGGTNITILEPNAFKLCTNLLAISVPVAITNIGHSVFMGCSNLTTATIYSQITSVPSNMFYNCKKLYTLTFPNISSIKNVEYGAFRGVNSEIQYNSFINITNVDDFGFSYMPCGSSSRGGSFPTNLISIGKYAFQFSQIPGTINLTSLSTLGSCAFSQAGRNTSATLTISTNLINIGTNCFESFMEISSQASARLNINYASPVVGTSMFTGCTSINTLTLSNTVTTISDSAFLSSLYAPFGYSVSVAIPDSVTYIGNYAFDSGFRITSLTLSTNLQSIGDYAFRGIGNANYTNKIYLPNLTSLGIGAFYNASSIRSLEFGNKLTNIPPIVFFRTEFTNALIIPDSVTNIGHSAFSGATNTPSVVVGKSVKSIGSNAFYNARGLQTVTMSDSVIDIQNEAFNSCTSLVRVILSTNLVTIKTNVFSNCTSLPDIRIPNNVTRVQSAFSNCTSLTKTIFNQTNNITIEGETFRNCTNLIGVYFRGNPPPTIPNSFSTTGTTNSIPATAYIYRNNTNWDRTIILPYANFSQSTMVTITNTMMWFYTGNYTITFVGDLLKVQNEQLLVGQRSWNVNYWSGAFWLSLTNNEIRLTTFSNGQGVSPTVAKVSNTNWTAGWQTLTVSRTGTNVLFKSNGTILPSSGSANASPAQEATPITIGSQNSGTSPCWYTGRIHRVSFVATEDTTKSFDLLLTNGVGTTIYGTTNSYTGSVTTSNTNNFWSTQLPYVNYFGYSQNTNNGLPTAYWFPKINGNDDWQKIDGQRFNDIIDVSR